jgi:hypothetical protein
MAHTQRICRALIALVALGFGFTAIRAEEITFTSPISLTGSVTTADGSVIFSLGGALPLAPLGELRLSDRGEVNFPLDLPPGDAATYFGSFTYTAPNGDRLSGTSLQILTLADPAGVSALTVIHTVTGGTGLFSGAAGEIVITGSFNAQTRTGAGVARGTLSAPGVAAIPEPGALLLVGTGLAAALLRRRGRGKAVG